jgi:LAO/AO transport system kinase
MQSRKAGAVESAYSSVGNPPAPRPTATMVRQIPGVLSLAPQHASRVPIIKPEAVRGEGIETLRSKLDEHRAYVDAEGLLSERRRRNLRNEVLGLATMRLRRALEASLHEDPEVAELLDAVVERRIDPASAASTILARGAIETREAAR